MSGYELLLLLHLLAAFGLFAGICCLMPVVVGSFAEEPAAERLSRIGTVLTAAGGGLALLFGLILVANRDYGLFDGWIIGSIVLWAASTALGTRVRGPETRTLFLAAVAASTGLLLLMIFKPGA